MDFGIDEEDAYQEVLRCLKSIESFLAEEGKDQPKRLSEVKSVRRRNEDKPLYRVWYRWNDLKKQIYPDSACANLIAGEDAKHISDLIQMYDEEMVLKILEVALKDWPAMRRRHGQKLPEIPTLRSIFRHREELANAAMRGGITVAEARVSRYAMDKESDASAWEKK